MEEKDEAGRVYWRHRMGYRGDLGSKEKVTRRRWEFWLNATKWDGTRTKKVGGTTDIDKAANRIGAG